MKKLIEIRNLTKWFHTGTTRLGKREVVRAVDDVSFHIQQREVYTQINASLRHQSKALGHKVPEVSVCLRRGICQRMIYAVNPGNHGQGIQNKASIEFGCDLSREGWT